jgi:hypothetical protein
MGILGYIEIIWPAERSPKTWEIPPAASWTASKGGGSEEGTAQYLEYKLIVAYLKY